MPAINTQKALQTQKGEEKKTSRMFCQSPTLTFQKLAFLVYISKNLDIVDFNLSRN
jgi:hypothetical protein